MGDRADQQYNSRCKSNCMIHCLHRRLTCANSLIFLCLSTFPACFLVGCRSPAPDPLITYQQLYVHPLTSSGAQFSTLPAAVQRTVCAETGSAGVAQVEKRVVGA